MRGPDKKQSRTSTKTAILLLIIGVEIYQAFHRTSSPQAIPDTTLLSEEQRDLTSFVNTNSTIPIPTIAQTPSTQDNAPLSPLQLAIANNNPNRKIVLVHVGKAGGLSVRKNLACWCWYLYPAYENQDPKNFPQEQLALLAQRREKCMMQYDHSRKLANQTRSFIHMFNVKTDRLEEATSFLMTFRDPVDRVHSTATV